jgi:hypothetical protein
MRKSLEIRNEKTILKFEAIQIALNLSAPQIIDIALDSLIVSMDEKQKVASIVNTFVTQSPVNLNTSVVTKVVESNK